MAFQRVIIPSQGGQMGKKLADFLGVDIDAELELTDLQAKLYERLYRSGAVRNLDGSRAQRRRARERQAEKRRRARAKEARRVRNQTRSRARQRV